MKIFNYINTPNVNIADAVVASMSIPVAVTPYSINGVKYVDGGYVDNSPTQYFDIVDNTKTLVFTFSKYINEISFWKNHFIKNNPNFMDRFVFDTIGHLGVKNAGNMRNTDYDDILFAKLKYFHDLRVVDLYPGKLGTGDFMQAVGSEHYFFNKAYNIVLYYLNVYGLYAISTQQKSQNVSDTITPEKEYEVIQQHIQKIDSQNSMDPDGQFDGLI